MYASGKRRRNARITGVVRERLAEWAHAKNQDALNLIEIELFSRFIHFRTYVLPEFARACI